MPYLPNTDADRQAMLDAIGVSNVDELLEMIPDDLRLDGPLNLPPGMGELELTGWMRERADRNTSTDQAVCFLGGGAYDHFIPAVVDHLAGRGEFHTAYTPYQPEASQGTLQAMFEYQTLIAQLTGMDVSNASLYDGATAAVEAVFMATAAVRRRRVLVADTVHPEYRQVLDTYLTNLDTEQITLKASDGAFDLAGLEATINDKTACVLVQHPNFFGLLEDIERIAEIVHAQGALLIVVVDPVSLGLLRRPGDCGADIVVAEGQSLGSPLAFGGPYLGILACREKFVRRMPGRLVGQTVDRRGKSCWVLTLQTREQHIRREKATSNICTNQGLLALRATIYLASMGPGGLRQVAELCARKTHYARTKLSECDSLSIPFDRPVFKEFVVRVGDGRVDAILDAVSAKGILAGIPLGRWYPELDDCFLVTVTEKRTKSEIDRLASCGK